MTRLRVAAQQAQMQSPHAIRLAGQSEARKISRFFHSLIEKAKSNEERAMLINGKHLLILAELEKTRRAVYVASECN